MVKNIKYIIKVKHRIITCDSEKSAFQEAGKYEQ